MRSYVMSRTYRRQNERHEYRWVLREWTFETGRIQSFMLDRHSPKGRRAIARFHSDAEVTMKGGAPHWFCRIFKRRQRNADTREFLRWRADASYEPMMNARHRNSAKWAWW
jgi:hypothetical protein